MNELLDTASKLVHKTGLTVEPNGNDVDIKLLNRILGRLSVDTNDPGLLMYTSADGYDVIGYHDDIQNAITNDLNNQIEYTEIKPGSFEEAITECIHNQALKDAIMEAYKSYKTLV